MIFSLTLLAAGVVWIGLTAWMAPAPIQATIQAPKEGFLAPDFSLQSLDGRSYTLGELKGKAIVLNLWTTWCAFCDSEMPAFQAVANSAQARENVVILAVNSTYQDSETAVAAFVQKHALTFPILMDTTGRVTRSYQVQALPTTYYIDRQGVIRNVTIGGPLTEASIQSQILSLLSQVP